jgi:hypothetical protein
MITTLRSFLRNLRERYRRDLPALTTFLLFFVVCFGPLVWRGKFLIGGDVFFYTHPLRTVAWDMIREGKLPLWTPQVLSGYPLLAMAQIGLAYPLTWAHLFLPSHVAEQLYIFAPFLLAPAFTYAYAREVGRSRTAALLAGLSFGYGGLMTNTYGMNGIPTNALMWLPLVLLGIERAKQRLLPSLVAVSLAGGVSILTGHAQSFVQLATVAVLYALFLALFQTDAVEGAWSKRWYPLWVALGSLVFAIGLAAFQILETMNAARQSVRGTLGYDFFSAGGFTCAEAVRSFIAPLYHYTEVTTYQAPAFLFLALAALLIRLAKTVNRDSRIFFWTGVAVCSGLLMLGGHTPIYQLLYRVPVVNLFRRPSRYAFEWTFAVSLLAAYGWDSMRGWLESRATGSDHHRGMWMGPALFFLCAVVGVVWWQQSLKGSGSEVSYVIWKLCFSIATSALVIYCWRKLPGQIEIAALLLICLVEPFILINKWWPGTAKPADRFTTPALTTRWLQQFPPEENRIYVRANGPDEEQSLQPRFDALDRTALFGVQNVGGYEPLILDRYSRALGNVDFDALNPRPGAAFTNELFAQRSHLLDLLNTTFVVAWSDLRPTPEQGIERDGVNYSAADLAREVKQEAVVTLPAKGSFGDRLCLVTSLSNSTLVTQGDEVARIRVFSSDSQSFELSLRAGVDTAEWAHERPDVRATIKHSLAPVFDQTPADPTASYAAIRFVTCLPFRERLSVDRIEIASVRSEVSLAIWKATVFDSDTGRSISVTNRNQANQLDSSRWVIEKEFDGVVILRNKRALPRAWLVTEALAVDEQEALERIQADSFDPKQVALLELQKDQLPQLSGGALPVDSNARVAVYEPGRLVIETNATTTTVLVVSEIYYPGWQATIDGQSAAIVATDFLLRGVAVPAGQHRVEMRYTAPAARKGLIISALTLFALIGIGLYSHRSRRI